MTRAQKTAAKKAAPAKKTTASRAPRTRKTAAAKKTTTPRLSLVKTLPVPERPGRRGDFVTDAQIYATHHARQAGIPAHRIRDWRDHRNNTATRPLQDGSLLHYDHTARTLTWQAICRLGATHIYVINSPSTASAARVHIDLCTTLHADLSTIPPFTADDLAALGLLQTPTWARPDLLGEAITETIPIPEEPIAKAAASASDTHRMSLDEIAQGLADRAEQHAADNDQAPKEHPQP